MATSETVDVVVIGAGQAGLTSAFHLRRAGWDFAVLDADRGPGGAWQHRWPSLRLGDVHGIHDLPGMELTERDGSRPASHVVADYFAHYERAFDLPVRRPVQVRSVFRSGHGFLVRTTAGCWHARGIINATGTWRRPFRPHYPGQREFRGHQLHTADFRSAEDFRGQHVLVVGGGISAVEHLGDLAGIATTTWVTRRPPDLTDAEFTREAARAAVAEADRRVRAGEPPGSVVGLTGLPPSPAIRRARDQGVLQRWPAFERLTATGALWPDGTELPADAVLWATAFRPDIAHLAPLHLREPAGGIRVEGTRAAREPLLHLVGYGPSASSTGANRAGRSAVHDLTRALRAESARALTRRRPRE